MELWKEAFQRLKLYPRLSEGFAAVKSVGSEVGDVILSPVSAGVFGIPL